MYDFREILPAVQQAVERLDEDCSSIPVLPIELGLSDQPRAWRADEFLNVELVLAAVLGLETSEISSLRPGQQLDSPKHQHVSLAFMVGYAGKLRTYLLVLRSLPSAA